MHEGSCNFEKLKDKKGERRKPLPFERVSID